VKEKSDKNGEKYRKGRRRKKREINEKKWWVHENSCIMFHFHAKREKKKKKYDNVFRATENIAKMLCCVYLVLVTFIVTVQNITIIFLVYRTSITIAANIYIYRL